MDGVLSDFLRNEEAGRDVDEVIMCCNFVAKSGAATERCAHDDYLCDGSRRRLYGFDSKCFLDDCMDTCSSWTI